MTDIHESELRDTATTQEDKQKIAEITQDAFLRWLDDSEDDPDISTEFVKEIFWNQKAVAIYSALYRAFCAGYDAGFDLCYQATQKAEREPYTPGKPQECPHAPKDCASCDNALDCFPAATAQK